MEYGTSMHTAHLPWHAALLRFKDSTVDQPAPERMNVFSISGFPNREIVSSNILAYFLDPANPHGLKDLLLQSLWELLKERGTDKRRFPDDVDLSNCSVATEYPAHGEGAGKGTKRIDILVKIDDRVAVIIENKVDAGLYNPLHIYRHQLESEGFTEPLTVVLHRSNDMAITAADDVNPGVSLFDLSYDDFFDRILTGLGEVSLNADLRSVDILHQFIDNYSPRRIGRRMNESNTQIDNFLEQVKGVEGELFQAMEDYRTFTKLSREKMHNLYLSLAEDKSITVGGETFTLFDTYDWRPQSIPTARGLRYNLPGIDDWTINIEFMLVSLQETIERGGGAGTMWCKAFWAPKEGEWNLEKDALTSPFYQQLDKSIGSDDEVIRNAMREKREKILAQALECIRATFTSNENV
ncbi:PD-(D/E)XK nuclease superfamily [Bifidobacterium pseudolongum subsp. pseudolongum]|uniref:PD-(D/E)XK nuclease superfamily n=1 Tax=Bifidobacterium pseudolongum subsp. pseudolongum TaxID=31954 RepID=A0A4Q5AB40_9BIFI|nr:PD-(D/E)XK nuclease family protein [Bifidobacterium pseudolongum]RYQ23700.1 PD-(D/E)XK nuclease superfamily [Bifidobacterium pseudolongum subsp. pseudolongum]